MSLTALLPAAIPGLAVLSAGVARAAASGLSFAAMLADPGGASPAVPSSSNKQDIPAELQKNLGRFAAMLKERLSAMGRSLAGTVEISADALGGIQASGERQDEQAVEQLLGQDQELSAAFFQLATAARGGRLVVGESGADLVTTVGSPGS